MVVFIVVLAIVAVGMAVWQRQKGQKGQTTVQPHDIWLHVLRGLCSLMAFLAFALFTNPALTCLFRDYSCKGIQTWVPDWVPSYVLAVVAAVLSAISAKVPRLVTDL